MKRTTSLFKNLMLTATLAATVSACNTVSRISEIGDGPELTQITNPTVMPNYRPVSMPMPAPKVAENNPNSLWRPGARAFFKDHRAKEVGDILTVSLALSDSAALQNKTERARTDSESANVTNLLGFETKLAKNNLPAGFSPTAAANFGNDHSTSGDGTIDRKETINLTFAAVVTQILPNGALVILGRQELMVNSEMRELELTGVVRPGDIDADNSIAHTRIAEMRVAYGGRGTLSNLQQPRWGTQLWDILFPF
ncbi:flagellar basal body L-ring protein FlgH [Magnetovibrio sp.]|uniref:flagellar basal body L-ring protein FlgH n=1 Tax=Magnetovibrio sp. TaxID=2024836 RepID=UPI002F934A61